MSFVLCKPVDFRQILQLTCDSMYLFKRSVSKSFPLWLDTDTECLQRDKQTCLLYQLQCHSNEIPLYWSQASVVESTSITITISTLSLSLEDLEASWCQGGWDPTLPGIMYPRLCIHTGCLHVMMWNAELSVSNYPFQYKLCTLINELKGKRRGHSSNRPKGGRNSLYVTPRHVLLTILAQFLPTKSSETSSKNLTCCILYNTFA